MDKGQAQTAGEIVQGYLDRGEAVGWDLSNREVIALVDRLASELEINRAGRETSPERP